MNRLQGCLLGIRWWTAVVRWELAPATVGGALLSLLLVVPGAAGTDLDPSIPLPDAPCPDGTERKVSHILDTHERQRLWIECHTEGEAGLPVRHGPFRIYAVDRSGGEVKFRLTEVTEYRDGTLHGAHRRWTGPGELVLDETLVDGELEGESRAWYSSGGVREVARFQGGKLHGKRRAWYRSGEERWTATYEHGKLVAFEGDGGVAGEPCPEGTLPVSSPDGLEEHCERRSGRWASREGAYVLRNADGEVVERGLYRNNRKAEVWEAPPGAPPSPDELVGVPAAEAWLLAGEQAYEPLAAAEANIWFRELPSEDPVYPEVERDGPRLLISELAPGSYVISLRVDADPSNPEYYPGDFGGSARFEVVSGSVTRFEIELDRVIHLTEPFDNNAPLRSLDLECDAKPILVPPTRFAWEPPVPPVPDIEYHYRVEKITCNPFLRPLGVVAEGATRGTQVELTLEPSRPGEFHGFRLWATSGSDGETVGFLTSHSPKGSVGWHVHFRVGGQ